MVNKNEGVIPFSLRESFDVKRLPEDGARNEIVATLRGALRRDGVCPAECQSERDEYLGLVQQVPAETNSDITVSEASELNHKKALDESRAV